jgi:hypothetical protein
MVHTIKWHIQPEKRSRNWALTIRNARFEIASLQKYTPSLNKQYIDTVWAESWLEALEEAEIEIGVPTDDMELTWADVFDKQYTL